MFLYIPTKILTNDMITLFKVFEKINSEKEITIDTFIELAKKSKDAKDFLKKSREIKNVPEIVADEFFNKYGDGGKLSMEETAKKFYDAVNEGFRDGAAEMHFHSLLKEWSVKYGVSFKKTSEVLTDKPSRFILDLTYDGYLQLPNEARNELQRLMNLFHVDFEYMRGRWKPFIR